MRPSVESRNVESHKVVKSSRSGVYSLRAGPASSPDVTTFDFTTCDSALAGDHLVRDEPAGVAGDDRRVLADAHAARLPVDDPTADHRVAAVVRLQLRGIRLVDARPLVRPVRR